MSTIRSFARSTGLTLAAAAAVAVFTGCSKKSEAPAAPEAASEAAPAETVQPSITTPELFQQPTASAPTDPSTVLAVVNGGEITYGEFDKEMQGVISRMQGRVPPERMAQMRMQMRDQLLDNMITRKILTDKIAAENITVSDEEFEEAVGELTESLPPGMTLEDMLAQAQTSQEEFRASLTDELKIRKLIESSVGKPTPPSDEELQAFYDENKAQFERPETVTASHILIGVASTDTDEDKAAKLKQIEDIRAQLLEGADFAEMAREHSTGPSGPQGGSLGSFPRGAMVPAFEEAAFSQEIDAIGEVVETQFGYHLVKVSEKNEAGVTPLEEVKEQLGEYLAGQDQQQKVQEFVKNLRDEAVITFPGQDDAAN